MGQNGGPPLFHPISQAENDEKKNPAHETVGEPVVALGVL